ncbi:MAG: hypothetical protein ABH827_06195 [bacterium]
MKKLMGLGSCFAVLFCFVTAFGSIFAAGSAVHATKAPRKIAVLTSKGGNGHMAACAVLKDIFPNSKITLFNPIYDEFHNVFDGEDLYVKLFQNGWIRTLNIVAGYVGPTYFKMNSRSIKKSIVKYLEQEKPDILISVIPLLNFPAYEAAQQCKTPFMNITLDADLTLWLLDMERCKTHNFVITVQAKTPLIKKQLARHKVPASCVREVGCSLRKDFFEKKDIQAIKKEWNIPTGKKVILLMRGGTGSTKLVDYVEAISELDKPLHLLVCIGKNTKLIKELEEVRKELQHNKKNKKILRLRLFHLLKKYQILWLFQMCLLHNQVLIRVTKRFI